VKKRGTQAGKGHAEGYNTKRKGECPARSFVRKGNTRPGKMSAGEVKRKLEGLLS